MADAFKIEPIGREQAPQAGAFVIDEIPKPTPVPPLSDQLGWMSNYEYYGVPELPTKEIARTGVETGGAFLGSAIGRRLAGPVGMRVGEAVGAGAGSLVSETFDPTANPAKTAAVAMGFTAGTGTIAEGLTRFLRWSLGKPHEAGQALIDNLALHNEVPPAGAVLDGPFAKDAQSVGGAAFFVGRRIEDAIEKDITLTSQNVKDYVSSFQRFHDGAKIGFKRADQMLADAGLADTRMVNVEGKTVLSIQDALKVWRDKGVLDQFPADLGWLARFNPNLPMPKNIPLTVNEAGALETLLYNRARAVATTPSEVVTEAAAKKLSVALKNVAAKVGQNVDDAIDLAIANEKLPADYRALMAQSKELWKTWRQGNIIEDMYLSASKDLTATTPITESKALINQLDNIIRQEKELKMKPGSGLITDEQKANIRKYALALQAAEESGHVGSFKLAARQGQLVGWTGLGGYLLGGTAGALTGASFVLAAPPALAFLFTNSEANALMIRGLRAEPGTATAGRISRELLTLLAANGYMPPERPSAPYLPRPLTPIPPPPGPALPSGGIRGQAPAGGGVDPFTSVGFGVR